MEQKINPLLKKVEQKINPLLIQLLTKVEQKINPLLKINITQFLIWLHLLKRWKNIYYNY